jgi:hypothetical protein
MKRVSNGEPFETRNRCVSADVDQRRTYAGANVAIYTAPPPTHFNDLEFPGGEKVLPWAVKLARRLSAFATRARRAGVPVIYVNDNFGQWRSNFEDVF